MQHENTFVCLDEVTGCCEELNPVIYNPNIDTTEVSCNRLRKVIHERYNFELSDDDLTKLTKYSSYELGEFIECLRNILDHRK